MRTVVFASLNALARSVVLVGALAIVHADEVRLNDGRVLEGTIISKADADVIDLRTGSSSMSVIQHFPRSQVASVSYGSSPRQEALAAIAADAKRLGDTGTAAQWWALAERAREVGESAYYHELAAITVERDRNHAAARRALGMVKYKGIWMRPNEAATARGEVFYEGRAMTWADKEEALRQIQVRKELLAVRKAEKERQAKERRLQAAAESAYSDPGAATGMEIYSSRPSNPYTYVGPAYRAIYWSGLYPGPIVGSYGGNYRTSNFSVSGSGQSSGIRWSFNWNN